MPVKIAPSILSADFSQLAQQVQRVETAGAEYLHLDIMDGHFVPNLTFGPMVVKALRPKSKLFFDVHLMVEHPEQYIADFAQAGADLITVHAESTNHVHRAIQMIKASYSGSSGSKDKPKRVKAGLALNPATPLSCLEHLYADLDLILLMTVNPGFAGQEFISAMLPKIRALHEIKEQQGFTAEIEVDGGVSVQNAPALIQAGAQILVAGTAVFQAPDIDQAIRDLRGS